MALSSKNSSVHLKTEVDFGKLSKNKRLNKLLQSVLKEVKQYADDQIKHIQQLTQIGIALSAEKDIRRLLEIIVEKARDLSNADAGTLYIIDDDRQYLSFAILQNDSLNTRIGGTSDEKIALPKVPLYDEGRPNYANVSSYCALTGETVNIPDVYEAEGFDFTGPRKYDESTGYRSRSMMVIPMKNHENEIIGVLQLLNAQEPDTGDVIEFSHESANLISSLASQAAVALTNTQLIQDLRNLLYAFIQSIATAIDAKSPYTGGHIKRVFGLTMMIAEKINTMDKGPFAEIFLSDDEIEELRLASWMHDVGKITTPEHVVNKATKLETILDRITLIESRFETIALSVENSYLQKKIEHLNNPGSSSGRLKELQRELEKHLTSLNQDFEFIKLCNHPGEFMDDDKIKKINQIAKKRYMLSGREHPYLTENEVENLLIRKGSLLGGEREIIEHHATMTMEILNKLPFPKKLANVPKFASAHHERLNGSGYPQGLSEKNLPLQSRILAVADIFEALTAKDRPYKKPMKLSQAIKIMGFMKDDKHIDADIYDLFMESGLFYEYARTKMNPEQIDEVAAYPNPETDK
jgi:HD-GYP domain-containing protein (c-di-GMP phosphodiesterase class II)